MLAEPKITSSGKARNYFEKDTYFINNEFEQGSFYGKLKDDLGLKDFNLKDFDSILLAKNPQTNEPMLKLNSKDIDENGERKRAACDLTFAADKSISILYETLDEDGKAAIRKAFNSSIDKALDFVEENYSNKKSRDKIQGEKAQSKMLFTRFDHSESRDNDMHLHCHCLAMNFVQDENGEYRAVEFNQIMMNHQLIGQIQRNELAKELQKLGYEVEISDLKNGSIKLKNVDKSLSKQFSQRSADIKEEMEKSGQTSYRATHTAQKQTAKWKDKNKDRAAIQEENIKKLLESGADIEKIQEKKEDLKIKNLSPREILELAFEDITDKSSVFKKEDILKQALKIALTSDISVQDLQKEFENYKELITINAEKNQYTTVEILEKEDYIFSKSENKTFNISSDKEYIEEKIKEFEKEKGYELKAGQSELVHTILSDESKYIITNGVAGAGKSTAFEIINTVANEKNQRIIGLAPTGTAVDNLSKEANIKESYTIAKFIQEDGMNIKNALIVVDEAGMMGLRDTHRLFEIAEKNNLKLVFSGDKNQKKSIQQGDIFAAMQKQGFTTVNLTEGNRQKTEVLKQAVSQILEKDITGALETLKDTTQEITNSKDRLAAAKDEYLKDRKNSLLITTTNADRVQLNQMIRDELVKNGEIKESKTFETREIPSMSALEKRSVLYYQEGEKVYLSKNLGSISPGREAIIKEVNQENNTLTIEHTFKDKTIIETIDLTKDGVSLNLFKETKSDFGIGEQIIMKKNDNKIGLKNGEIGEITAISKDEITVQFEKKEVKINVKNYPYLQHAYAITDFASQGKTTEKVIAVANSQAASFNDFYTQITRAKNEAHIITDSLEELKNRAANDSSKLNARELLDEYEKIQQESKINKEEDMTKRTEIKKLTPEEFNELAAKTKAELKITDPAPVIEALNIEFKKSGGKYEFKMRGENTASANLYIDAKGEWKYKDFGSGKNGTIENLVMDSTNSAYKDALEFAIQNSGVKDYVKSRLEELNGKPTQEKQSSISVNEMKHLKEENLKTVESKINSKVTEVKEINNYKPVVDYLASRGITKIPPELKLINGEYTSKNGETKKVFGVGIETQGQGADIHFLKPIGSLKTMSLENKNISLFESQVEKAKVAIFESKMDYAAAYQQQDFSNTDIIIGNSTSNALKVAEHLKENNYTDVMFYNQNDEAGRNFVKEIIEKANIQKFNYIRYKKEEQKQDINDLIQRNIKLEERIQQNRQPQQEQKEEKGFVKQLLETYEKVDDLLEKADTAGKLSKRDFVEDLEKIQKADVQSTFEFLNNTINNNINHAKQLIVSVARAVKEVSQDGTISLSGVARAISSKIKDSKIEKTAEREL